jgi:hypothetical protein
MTVIPIRPGLTAPAEPVLATFHFREARFLMDEENDTVQWFVRCESADKILDGWRTYVYPRSVAVFSVLEQIAHGNYLTWPKCPPPADIENPEVDALANWIMLKRHDAVVEGKGAAGVALGLLLEYDEAFKIVQQAVKEFAEIGLKSEDPEIYKFAHGLNDKFGFGLV